MRTAWCLVLVVACQQAPSKPAGSGSGSGSAQTVKPAGGPTTLDIALPALSGKPPVKTTRPLDKPALLALSKREFPEFTVEATEFPENIAIRQRAAGKRPRMSVNIYVGPCTEKLPCLPMQLDAWRAEEAALRTKYVDAELVHRPETTFELGPTTIGGAPAIFTYQAGQYFGRDERGNPVGSYSHAYTVHYNDGVNSLRVIANYADDPRESLAEMKRALPREFLERVAIAFLDSYAQAWR